MAAITCRRPFQGRPTTTPCGATLSGPPVRPRPQLWGGPFRAATASPRVHEFVHVEQYMRDVDEGSRTDRIQRDRRFSLSRRTCQRDAIREIDLLYRIGA